MLFLHVKKHFGARTSEWMLAGIMLSIGLILLRTEDTFSTSPAYVGMARIASEQTWAIGCTIVGVLRLVALTINGLWVPTTYHLRSAASFVSCFIWTQIMVGAMTSGIAGLGIAVFPWILLWDIITCHRTAVDYRMGKEALSSVTK